MKLKLIHGRLDPTTGGTDLEGNPVDDWGFDGPVLENVSGMHWTYGTLRVEFNTEDHTDNAQALTGWDDHGDYALDIDSEQDCIRIYNAERGRFEYFGDFSLEAD